MLKKKKNINATLPTREKKKKKKKEREYQDHVIPPSFDHLIKPQILTRILKTRPILSVSTVLGELKFTASLLKFSQY